MLKVVMGLTFENCNGLIFAAAESTFAPKPTASKRVAEERLLISAVEKMATFLSDSMSEVIV